MPLAVLLLMEGSPVLELAKSVEKPSQKSYLHALNMKTAKLAKTNLVQ